MHNAVYILYAIVFRVSSFYNWNVLILSNTNIFRKLLPNHTDFFRVHINQCWYFQRVIIKLLTHTFEISYIPRLIFSDSYYPTIHIFHSSYKPLLTNKIIKTFSEFIPNNINIFGDLLSSNTDFFRVYIKQYTFSDKITANNVDHVQINYPKQSFRFRFILIILNNCTKFPSS